MTQKEEDSGADGGLEGGRKSKGGPLPRKKKGNRNNLIFKGSSFARKRKLESTKIGRNQTLGKN